jgi:xynB
MIFMSSRKELYTLQHIVMKLVTEKDAAKNMASSGVNLGIVSNNVTSDSIQFASIIVSILPIVAVYPFMQKYFIKGVLIGSVKG